MIVLVIGFLDSVVDRHSTTWTVPVFTTTPIGDVLVIITPNLVVSITVEYESSSASLSGNE